jgi:hypothetical protein
MLDKWFIGIEKVHIARTQEEKEAIYRLRYEIYVEELQKGFLKNVDHTNRWVCDENDKKESTILFYTGSGKEITGTLRIEIWEPGKIPAEVRERFSLHLFPAIDKQIIIEASRLIVRPNLRGKLILPALARAAYEHACSHHLIYFSFVYCAPGLVRAYRKLGYRPYSAELIYNEDGVRVPLVMITSDIDYFKKQHSPFTSLVHHYFGPGKLPVFDITDYQTILEEKSGHLECDAVSVWEELERELQYGEDKNPVFLNNLPSNSLKVLGKKGFIIDVPQEKTIVRAQLVEKEMFLIIDGVFEVLSKEGKRIAILYKGDIFGEIAFLLDTGKRTATIRSITSGKLLVLRRKFLNELMKEHPKMAMNILYNISRIMAERFANMCLSQEYDNLQG